MTGRASGSTCFSPPADGTLAGYSWSVTKASQVYEPAEESGDDDEAPGSSTPGAT